MNEGQRLMLRQEGVVERGRVPGIGWVEERKQGRGAEGGRGAGL